MSEETSGGTAGSLNIRQEGLGGHNLIKWRIPDKFISLCTRVLCTVSLAAVRMCCVLYPLQLCECVVYCIPCSSVMCCVLYPLQLCKVLHRGSPSGDLKKKSATKSLLLLSMCGTMEATKLDQARRQKGPVSGRGNISLAPDCEGFNRDCGIYLAAGSPPKLSHILLVVVSLPFEIFYHHLFFCILNLLPHPARTSHMPECGASQG